MATSVNADQAAFKVFGIPELARLICVYVRKSDNSSLMCACRRLFSNILPFVWEQVEDVIALVSMIPGGGMVTYDPYPLSPLVVMRCPTSLDLSRFNIYAPHVKRVVLPLHFHVDQYDNWDEFLACTHSVDLLPNLESIHLSFPNEYSRTFPEDRIDIDTANWIMALLSASLQELVMTPLELTQNPSPLAWVDLALSLKLLASVSQKCPNIRTLKVTPGNVHLRVPSYYWSNDLVRSFSFSYNSPEASLSVLSFKKLATLLVSPFMLSPELVCMLATLPALESLFILGLPIDFQEYCRDLQLPTESFPSLKHLELNHLSWETMLNICKLEPMISGLCSLSITHSNGTNIDLEDANRPQPGFFNILGVISGHTPKLSTLSVRLAYDLPGTVRPESIESWKCLPLDTLRLGWSVMYSPGFETLHRLLSSWPLLEDVVLGSGSSNESGLDLPQLREVVGLLPRLRRIRAPIAWESVRQLTQADFRPLVLQPENPLFLKTYFYLPEPQVESAEDVARFLFALRPMSRVICQSDGRGYYGGYLGLYECQEPEEMIIPALARYYS